MTILRTPNERFAHLPDYPFGEHYALLRGGLRMHYVDEGSGEVELMLHGEPTWSYLYRKMIPILTAAGYRVIAPDLIGFGKSDKILEADAYSYASHAGWLTELIESLRLQNITLVCQDWGGLLGLRIVGQHPEWFARVVAANTFLPTGDQPPSEAFLQWRQFSQHVPTFPVGAIVNMGCVHKLSADTIAAYDAPFPEEQYKTAARVFPTLVPISPNDPASAPNREAWEVLKTWHKPFLTCFSDSDPITRGGDTALQKLIPGTQGLPHVVIEQGGHFLQEDQGQRWAEYIVAFLKQNPLPSVV